MDWNLGGLVKYNKKTHEIERHIKEINNAFTILEDINNPDILWINTYQNGFFKYNKKTNKFVNFKHNPKDKNSISADSSFNFIIDKTNPNILWIATLGGGLDKLDTRINKFINFKHDSKNKNSISSNVVWNLYQDSNNTIWVFTDNGLNKLDTKAGKFYHYRKDFPGKVAFSGIEDDLNNLWITTNGGLVKFNLKNEQVSKVYTSEDGLHSHSFFAIGFLKTKDGEFFLGGFNGLNTFRPENLKDNKFKPPIYLTTIEQSGKTLNTNSAIEKAEEIVLNEDNNFFEFEYAALNYTNSAKNRYKYILEGRDKEWFDAGTNRIARYTGLEPGMYILKIQGSNNDGLWSDKEAKLNIYVKPDRDNSVVLFTQDELINSPSLSLARDNEGFTFEVAPKDYSIVEDNRYSYILEGYDKHWINSGNKRYVNYSQVPAGSYRLKVKDGDKTIINIPVVINPPFYQTWWFRSLMLVIFLILVIIIYYLRTRALRRKHAELERVVNERTSELKKTNKDLEIAK